MSVMTRFVMTRNNDLPYLRVLVRFPVRPAQEMLTCEIGQRACRACFYQISPLSKAETNRLCQPNRARSLDTGYSRVYVASLYSSSDSFHLRKTTRRRMSIKQFIGEHCVKRAPGVLSLSL